MGLGYILFVGGLVIIVGLYIWSRQRQKLGYIRKTEPEFYTQLPQVSGNDAIIVSREHGQLVYVNERARHWLGMNGGEPNLEFIAGMAQPSDSFLELFASEGQASFQLGSRWVEASSHTIPTGSESRLVVVMRELSSNTTHPDELDLSLAMNTINEIGESVNVSMTVQEVHSTLLKLVTKAIPAESGEICLWDEVGKILTPEGWQGDSNYLIKLHEQGGGYKVGEGITGWIAQYRKPVLVASIFDRAAVQPKLGNFFRSFVGVPLMLGETFIGTLELAHTQPNQFNQSHLAFLQAISKQVAISIHNADLYARQMRRIDEMASLQDLMQGTTAQISDVKAIYRTLNERIAKLVGADVCGVLLYDEARHALIPELPFHGLPDHLALNCVIPLPEDSPQRDIWERQRYWVTNDAPNESLIEALGLAPVFSAAGIRNTALLPMEVGSERIGMLQICNKQSLDGFLSQDIREMQLMASQATVVVENLRLSQREHRRDTELTGLQDITHAIDALGREEEFYATINKRMAELMSVEMCGILLYDEASHRLVSQLPFYGVPDEKITDYIIDLKPGSPLADIWEEVDYWYTNQVQANAVVHASGLADFATKVGVNKTLLALLSVGGRRLGVVQASNKLNGEDFDDKDARLLLIFATQVAAMVENARLYRDMHRSAQQATSLARVAELSGGILTSDDSFVPLLSEISTLTRSPLVFIHALDQQTGGLVAYPRWVFGSELHEPIVYDTYNQHFEYSVAISHQPFVSNDLTDDSRVLETYRPSIRKFDLKSVVLVPLVVGDRSMGELGVANRRGKSYTDADERLLVAIAAQVAATIERLRLYEAAGQNLSRRLLELDGISRISSELTQTLDIERILDVIRHEAARATRADGSTVVMLKPKAMWESPDKPEMESRLGDRKALAELADIERDAVSRGADTVMVVDYTSSELKASPENARSAIAVAFLYEDEVIGVIHLHHTRPNNFDDRAAGFLLTVGAKASLGYGNYRRYQEQLDRSNRLRRRVEQLNQIFELGQMLQSNVDQVTMLEAILYSVQQSVGFDSGVVVLLDDESKVLRRVAQVGMPLEAFEASKAHAISLTDLDILLQPKYQVSESFFFPIEGKDKWASIDLQALSTGFTGKSAPTDAHDAKAWRDGDMLLVPLMGPGGNRLGVISLDRPHPGQRPDRGTMEVLEIFAHQAAAIIENMRLYLASVQSAEQEARLNEMMEKISGTLDVTQIVEAVAYGVLRLVPFGRMTAAIKDVETGGFDIFTVTIGNDSALTVGQEHRSHIEGTAMMRAFLDGRDVLYMADSPAVQEYDDLRSWHMHGEQISLILPLFAGTGALGVIHLGSDSIEQRFEEFRPLLKRMANLSAVSIQNAQLFHQAINLQGFNESVVESIQQGIVVLDKSGRILSVNDFMHQRYGWSEAEALHQDLFAYRPDLATILKGDIREVLENGQPRERIGQSSVMPDGKHLVRNFYSYPLQTADTIRGAVLLVEDVTERARLERDVEARANQLSVLTEVSSRITASLNREEVINLVLNEIGRIIQYDTMTLWGRSADTLNLEGVSGLGRDISTVADEDAHISIASHERMGMVIERKAPFTISRFQGYDALLGEAGAKSWLGVPLVNQGNVVGLIALAKQEERFYDSQAEQAAFAFANQVAIALENANLYAEAQHQTERLGLLNRVSVTLAQSLDSESILETALLEIARAMTPTIARALIFERDLQIGRVIVQYPRGDAPPDETIKLQESALYQQVRRTAAPLIIENLADLDESEPISKELEPRHTKSYVMIPMTVGGQVIGAFELEVHDKPRFFTAEQIDLGLIIANQAAIAVQNTNLLEQTLIRTRELETLLEAAQTTSLTLNLEDAYKSVAALILHALDMDDCAVMTWDNVENNLQVEVDQSRFGEYDKVAPHGTRYNLRQYPARLRSLNDREVLVIRSDQPGDSVEVKDLIEQGGGIRVLIPLVVRDQAIGMVQAQQQMLHRPFSHREVRLAQALGAQAATAIQNARLSTETAALVEEGFIINNLSQAISSTLSIEDMITIVRDQVPQVTDAEEMYLALYDVDTQMVSFPMVVRNGQDLQIPPRALNTDEVSFIIKHRRSLSLGGGNWSSEEMRRNLGISNGEDDAKSYLGVPIAAGDQVLGVLAVRDSESARAFGINDERLLVTVGTQLGAAIQNARLFKQVSTFADELNQRVKERTEELQLERDRIDTLYRITSELARTLDMDRVLKRALEMVASAVTADDGVIMMIEPLSDKLQTRAALTGEADESASHPAEQVANWLLTNDRVLIVNDLRKQSYWNKDLPGAKPWRSALGVLLESNDDPQGVMVLLSHYKNAFTETQLKLVVAAANQVAAAINNADLYHLIRDQAERLGTLVRIEQEEAEKNSAIVEGIADGILLADSEGAIIQFNSAAERILELPRDQVIGQAMFKLTGLFGGSAVKWARAIESWMHNPEGHKTGEFLAETLDLGDKVIQVHLSPVHTGERFLGTVAVFRDTTKEVEADRVKSAFVSNVSHELRTPMTSIKGFADLLLMGVAGDVSEPQRTFLNKIKGNADRLSQLVDDLLNISKIDAGERLNVDIVELSEVIPNVLATLEGRAEHEQKQIHVTVDVQAGLPPVEADAHKLTQIVTNVVDNAFNYTPAGGNIDVKAELRPDGQHILISVKDTGIGIPEEFRDRIWGRFERYEDHALVMDVPGTGLGLSIVKELVQMHHGEIWFESEVGTGTTFFVSLPVEQPKEEVEI